MNQKPEYIFYEIKNIWDPIKLSVDSLILILLLTGHLFCLNLPRYPEFISIVAIFGSFLQKFPSYFKIWTIFLCLSKRGYLLYMISGKNTVIVHEALYSYVFYVFKNIFKKICTHAMTILVTYCHNSCHIS